MIKKFFTDIAASSVFRFFISLSRRLRRHHLSEYSAYSVMFIILSFIPFFVILLSIMKALPVFSETEGYRITGADEFIEYLRELMNGIDVKTSGAVLSLTTILSLWSASRGLIGIINGLNRIHNVSENRGFFRIRFYSALYTLLLMAVIIVVLVILIFGEALLKKAEQLLNLSIITESNAYPLRWFIGFLLLAMFFTLIYCALPTNKSRPLKKLPGAFFSAGGWTGFSALYSIYINHFADYPAMYGRLSLPVTAILWLYICMYILFLGEELNIMLEDGIIRRFVKAFS